MRKKYFFGKYYKFIGSDSFSFALIDSDSNDGEERQIILPHCSVVLKNKNSIIIENDSILFDVNQEDLKIKGKITLGILHPLKRDAMGPFKFFKMECRHSIYSMYHSLSGTITINDKIHSFNDGFGYIEGDSGVSFPQKYVWYNSIGKDYGVMLAIATIPFGLINFKGILGFVSYKGKEYYLTTYTGAKIVKLTEKEIIIKKGKYVLKININRENNGHLLKAPENGKMSRLIRENIAIPSSFYFLKHGEEILKREDELSSLEYVF